MKIAVIGSGTSATLSILAIKKNFPDAEITQIIKDYNIIGVGEATIPETTAFMDSIGLSSDFLIRNCDATLKIGVKFENWGQSGDVWFAFGNQIKDAVDSRIAYNDFINGKLPHGIHFNTKYLQKYGLKIADSIECWEVKDIQELKDYDVIINCCGFNNFIELETVDTPLTRGLKNNCALVYNGNHLFLHKEIPESEFLFQYSIEQSTRVPYSTFTACSYGWQWTIPTEGVNRMGYVFNKENLPQAITDFRAQLKYKYNIDASAKDFRIVDFKNRISKNYLMQYKKQIIASIGLSSCFIEPLQATGLYLTGCQVQNLISVLKTEKTIGEANIETCLEAINCCAFVLANLKNCKLENEYWDSYKSLDIPDAAIFGSNVFSKLEMKSLIKDLQSTESQKILNARNTETISYNEFRNKYHN